MMMLYMMMAIFLADFLYTGLREEVKATGAEDPITLPITGSSAISRQGSCLTRSMKSAETGDYRS